MFSGVKAVFDRFSPTKRKIRRPKVERNLEAELMDDDSESEEVSGISFNAHDKQFLMDLVTQMSMSIEDRISSRVDPLAIQVKELKAALDESTKTIASLKQGVPNVDIEKLREDITKHVIESMTKSRLSGPPGIFSSSSSQSDLSSCPDAADILWILGSLGRDLEKQEALDRARQALAHAGAHEPDELFAPYGLGSQCFLKYYDQHKAAHARNMLRRKPTKFPGEKDSVWMDIKRSREERLPKIVLKELERAVGEISHMESKQWKIIRCPATKRIYINRKPVVKVSRDGEIQWCNTAEEPCPILETQRKDVEERIRKFVRQ